MNITPLNIVATCVALVIAVLITGRIILSNRFGKHVARLFANPLTISNNVFRYDQLVNLPDPVQRYFKNVLRDGQLYTSQVRLKHDGQFKSDIEKDWTNIDGEEYFTASPPGFVWKGSTKLFTAIDMFVGSKGNLIVSLLSLFRIGDHKGPELDQSELMRWVAECVWFPTSLLPSENLQWIPVDHNTATLSYHYDDLKFSYHVGFNTDNEIIQLETERNMGNGGLEKWIARCSNYKKMDEVSIPMSIEVLWRLKAVDYSYARFHVLEIEYNKPFRF